jgi:hypothetical protein
MPQGASPAHAAHEAKSTEDDQGIEQLPAPFVTYLAADFAAKF